MAKTLTGIMAIAAASITDNKGITVNPNLIVEVNRFNTNGLIAIVQTRLSESDTALKNSIALLPNFMTGTVLGLTQNLPSTVLIQAQSLVADLKKFAVIFQLADSFVNNSNSLKQAVGQAENLTFDDLGFMYKNYNDVLTGGVSNQFNTDYLPQLASEFKNLGSLFDIGEYSRLDDPSVMIQNLIQQGFGTVAGLESQVSAAGIDLDNIEDPDDCDFQPILSSVVGNDLDTIFKNTNFQPYKPDAITDLSKVFDIENVFSPTALKSLGPDPSLENLSRKLSNVGGFFKDSANLSEFYASLNIKKLSHLDSLTTVVPSELSQTLKQNLGTGTGPNSSATMLDILGSISGIGYTESFRRINDSLATLVSIDTDVQMLITELNKTNYNLATVQALINTINAKPTLQNVINQGNLDFASSSQKYQTEIANQLAAKIVPADLTGTNDDVINFVYSLQRVVQQPNDFGTQQLLEKATTNDVNGESILGLMQEAKNLRAFQTVGINPNTYID